MDLAYVYQPQFKSVSILIMTHPLIQGFWLFFFPIWVVTCDGFCFVLFFTSLGIRWVRTPICSGFSLSAASLQYLPALWNSKIFHSPHYSSPSPLDSVLVELFLSPLGHRWLCSPFFSLYVSGMSAWRAAFSFFSWMIWGAYNNVNYKATTNNKSYLIGRQTF